MSKLIFDGIAHSLTLVDASGTRVGGPWPANNVVERKASLRFVPNGIYPVLDQTLPHSHGQSVDSKGILQDSPNGRFGLYGIIRLRPFMITGSTHKGVGIHSGRIGKGAQNAFTDGCIRTTDAAMLAITRYMSAHPLSTLTVLHNSHQSFAPLGNTGNQQMQPLHIVRGQ